jgi:hypothetical protein
MIRPGPVVGTDTCGCLIYLCETGGDAEARTSHQAYCPVAQAATAPEPTPLSTVLLCLAAMVLLWLALGGVAYLAVVNR